MSTPVRNRKPTKRALESTSPIIANQLKKKRPPVGSPSSKTTPTTPPKSSSISATISALSAAISAAPVLPNLPPQVGIPLNTVPITVVSPAEVHTSPPKTASSSLPVATTTAASSQLPVLAEVGTANSNTPSPVPSESETKEVKTVVFKDPNFRQQSKGSASTSGRRTRLGKSLKQIIALERTLPWKPGDVTYGGVDAPPSFKPAKKYSDITGLPAKYTDPHSKIRYATTEEFARIRILPSDIVSGYLTLRKANAPVP